MKTDSDNLTRWKHLWSWHIRGCVWDKVASEWASKEEWSSKRKKCLTAEDRRDFITVALHSVKHSTVHTSRTEDKKTPSIDRTEPRPVEAPDISIRTREEGPTVQLCGDNNVAEKWIICHHALGQ